MSALSTAAALPHSSEPASTSDAMDTNTNDKETTTTNPANPSSARDGTTDGWSIPDLQSAAELAPQPPNSKRKELYWDRSHYASHQAQISALKTSRTVYVGNLAFTTHSRLVQAHFGRLGPVQTVYMGLDRLKHSRCGFCFVQYQSRRHALLAVSVLSGTKLDGSSIRVELDAGFQDGRQFGRGARGGQVRHDRKRVRTNNTSNNNQYSQYSSNNSSNNNSNNNNTAPPSYTSYGNPSGDSSSSAPPIPTTYTPSAPSDLGDARNGEEDDEAMGDAPSKRQRTE